MNSVGGVTIENDIESGTCSISICDSCVCGETKLTQTELDRLIAALQKARE